MRAALTFVEDTCRAFAALYLVAALGPAIEDPASSLPSHQTILGAVGVLVVGLSLDLFRAARPLLGRARSGVRALHRAIPSRGHLGRWYHYAFREPLAAPDQAREALARLCGYRLQAGDYRLVSLRPSIRGLRLGVLVTVTRGSRSGRHWECRYVRRVADPHELWLIRSAVRHVGETSAVPLVAEPGSDALGTRSEGEMDALLGRPGEGPDQDGQGPVRRSPP